MANDNNKIIIILKKRQEKLVEELQFQNFAKGLYQNSYWLKLNKDVFLEFPQGVQTRTSGFRGI